MRECYVPFTIRYQDKDEDIADQFDIIFFTMPFVRIRDVDFPVKKPGQLWVMYSSEAIQNGGKSTNELRALGSSFSSLLFLSHRVQVWIS